MNWDLALLGAIQIMARNPHAVERYIGGSSSGPAAIVSCGLCPATLGTDGGGSIRIPSSLFGVVGFKTNYGRTSRKGETCLCRKHLVLRTLSSFQEKAFHIL